MRPVDLPEPALPHRFRVIPARSGAAGHRRRTDRGGVQRHRPAAPVPAASPLGHPPAVRARPAGAAQAGGTRPADAGRAGARTARAADGRGRRRLVALAADRIRRAAGGDRPGHLPRPGENAERDRLLDEAWLLLAPSVKEGWGIAIMEAAARAVPAIGYRSAGGVTESIQDGETGLLVADQAELTERAGPAHRHRGQAGDGQEGPGARRELRLAELGGTVRAAHPAGLMGSLSD